MKTKSAVLLVMIFIGATLNIGCEKEDEETQSRIEVENFKVEVFNDTVPSEVHVITKYNSFGSVELKYTHEGAYYTLNDTEQRNTTTCFMVSDSDNERIDSLVLFYKNVGIHVISLDVNDENYEEQFELFEK